MQFDASQTSAIERACRSKYSIITGGAGTGKTSIISEITSRIEAAGGDVALAAFAGKAAARIREACSHPASTIHRLLGYDGRGFRTESLSDKSVVIDEASMIDTALLSEVIARKPRQLCLVGDAAQLPPVGRGQPFHDLLNIRPDMVSTLTTCYRATEAVYKAASAIRAGGRPAQQDESANEKWTMMNTGDPKRTHEQIMRWVESGAIDFEKDIILCARNGEEKDEANMFGTVRGLNKSIVDMISPREKGQPFNVGDRVINTKNLPDLDVWNGTTGTIHAIDIDGGVWVHTDVPVIDRAKTKDDRNPVYAEFVLFEKDKRRHLDLAYALTVHKSQGSQYRNVLVCAFHRDLHSLLDRSLLYTGVTRTKQRCCVVGELSAVYAAIDKQNHKRTILQELAA